MSKGDRVISTAIWVFTFSVMVAHAQEDMRYIDNECFQHPKRPSATFIHDQHNEKAGIDECNRCHHVYQEGVLLEDESSEDQRCVDCHGEKQTAPLPLMKAFHLNCKGCHQEQKAGPIMCGQCHRKK